MILFAFLILFLLVGRSFRLDFFCAVVVVVVVVDVVVALS